MITSATSTTRERTKMKNEILWQSKITADMVAHLNEQEISLLINELDDVVATVAENYEVN
jgi:formamidopyrimidine-DNA glycosylase